MIASDDLGLVHPEDRARVAACWRDHEASGVARCEYRVNRLDGSDTFKGDPVGGFALLTDDYSRMGQAFSQLGVPTLFVMEGGYAVEEIGLNVAKVLTGFLG